MLRKTLTPEEIAKAAKFSDRELAFINRIAASAFRESHRPYALVAICGSILANLIDQSEGDLNEKGALKWLKMAMHPENLDPKP